MNKFTERIAQGRTVWIEYFAYAGKLLSGGDIPWLHADQFVSWQKKAASLLHTDVVSLPVGQIARDWCRSHPPLLAAMAEKRRTGVALRVLLADADLRAHLADTARGLRACFPDKALALCLPSPGRWVREVHALSFDGEGIEASLDHVDSATVYIADFLRGFASVELDIVLLDEDADSESELAAMIDMLDPLVNLASHYRWSLGLQVAEPPERALLERLDFWISRSTAGSPRCGLDVGPAFWASRAVSVPPELPFVYVEVPADERPELVLERLATLR